MVVEHGHGRATSSSVVVVAAYPGTARDPSLLEPLDVARRLRLDATHDDSITSARAEAIRGAIEDPSTPLRVPVGEDAVTVLSARAQLDDVALESAMRRTLDLTR
jgi:hypothetical protein